MQLETTKKFNLLPKYGDTSDGKTFVPYSDAPSGMIHLYNYKQPFMKTHTGIGFQGVLAHDAFDQVVQCSICGEWKQTLAAHIVRAHGITSREYKQKFGLAQSSALCSESFRSKKIESGLRNGAPWLANNSESYGKAGTAARKARRSTTTSVQRKNSSGTCPEQLLYQIYKLSQELGRRPKCDEFKSRYNSMFRAIQVTFGTWNNAVQLLGWSPISRGVKNRLGGNWSKDSFIDMMCIFYNTHGRLPSTSDSNRRLMPWHGYYRKFFKGGIGEARELAKIELISRREWHGQ